MTSTPYPYEWTETTLGEIIELKYGKALPATIRDGSGFPVYGSNGPVGLHSSPSVLTGGIVIGRKGSVGEVHKSNGPFSPIDTTYFVDELREQPIGYWFYFLKSLPLTELNRSTAIPGLNREDAYSLSIGLPPLAEQKQIAAKLDELLAQVDTIKARLDAIPKILKRFRQSVLAAAVSGRLTEEWRAESNAEQGARQAAPLQNPVRATYSGRSKQRPYEIQSVPPVGAPLAAPLLAPDEWRVERAEDICAKVQSGSTPKNNPFDQNGNVPFLKVYNIVNQKIDFDYKPQFVTKKTHEGELKRSIALPNDVLMNIVGPPLGKIALLTNQYSEWNINQAITLFRCDETTLLSKYLYFVLLEGELVRKVMPDTKGSVGQVNISLSQCRNALIAVPPLEEQTEIVRRIEQLFAFADQIETRVKDATARVNHLTQSILAKAFRGELTADWRAQNPELISGENSAEALLARIRAERENTGRAKKSRQPA